MEGLGRGKASAGLDIKQSQASGIQHACAISRPAAVWFSSACMYCVPKRSVFNVSAFWRAWA